MLINQAFFVRDINIPNTTDAATLERVNMFIQKYESQCLLKTLGYPLYRALTVETIGITLRPIIRSELKNDEQIQVGVTPGLVAGGTTVTFDGTGGTPDFRGYKIVPSELNGRGIMILDTDYSYNPETGKFDLLLPGDKFQSYQYYNIHFGTPLSVFVNQTTGSTNTQRMLDLIYGKEYIDGFTKEWTIWQGLIHDNDISLIASYVYFYYQKENVTHMTGVGNALIAPETGTSFSPGDKMLAAWNFYSKEVQSLLNFLWNFKTVYPEFTYRQHWITRAYSRTINKFNI